MTQDGTRWCSCAASAAPATTPSLHFAAGELGLTNDYTVYATRVPVPLMEAVDANGMMYLTCAAYGLGAFWATGGALTGEGMRKHLGLGENGHALGLFHIGYPAVDWPKGYRKPLDQVVTWKGG